MSAARSTPTTTHGAAVVVDLARQPHHLLGTQGGLQRTSALAAIRPESRAGGGARRARSTGQRRIVVVGVDLAASLSWFLAYGLTALGFDAEAPAGSSGNLLHHVRFLTSKDLLIAISFRKCLKATVDAASLASSHGVPTFAVTDSGSGPLGTICDGYLAVSIQSSSIAGSYVAPMAALNAIVVACSHLSPRRSLKALRNTQEDYLSGPHGFAGTSRRRIEQAQPPETPGDATKSAARLTSMRASAIRVLS